MFILELYDRKGKKLNTGDIVRVSDGKRFTFYSEVKYLEIEQAIAPFSTFSFHSFEKVDKVPDDAIKSTESRYDIWYRPVESDEDLEASDFEKYLMDWRHCENHIDKRTWRIKELPASAK